MPPQCASASAEATSQVLASLLLLFLAADLGEALEAAEAAEAAEAEAESSPPSPSPPPLVVVY